MPTPLIPARIRSTASATNVRNAPNGTVLGVINNVWQETNVPENYAVLDWVNVKVQTVKNGVQTGFVSRQYVEIEKRVVIPPPSEEPELVVDLTITITPSVRDALQEMLTSLLNAKQLE